MQACLAGPVGVGHEDDAGRLIRLRCQPLAIQPFGPFTLGIHFEEQIAEGPDFDTVQDRDTGRIQTNLNSRVA